MSKLYPHGYRVVKRPSAGDQRRVLRFTAAIPDYHGKTAPLIHGILFDLDGTLLDIDLDSFLRRYFDALSGALMRLDPPPASPNAALRAVNSATRTMMAHHPGSTNRAVFETEFAGVTGIDLREHASVFERFYAEEFPNLGDGYGPKPGAHDAVKTARQAGHRIGLATNPIFPRAAVVHRLAWAGFDESDFDVITSYETMEACKPHPHYFRQTAEQLEVSPQRCLMVGDDRVLDLAAADVGMKTFYVGDDPDAAADYAGDLDAVALLLTRLASTPG